MPSERLGKRRPKLVAPAKEPEEKRAPEVEPQLLALAKAETEGKLPDVDRRGDVVGSIPTGSVETPVPIVAATSIPAPVAVAPDVVETPAPLVPLAEVAPLTVEAAVQEQNIPNDRIHHVHEREDGTKVDALGHIFEPAPKLK